MPATVTVSYRRLRSFCARALESAGVPPEDARITADVLVEADLRGVHSHGATLLPTYVRRLRNGLTNPTPAVKTVRDRGAIVVLDGDFGLGHVLGHAAMSAAIGRAQEFGVGLATVRRSTHYGMAGYYAMMASRRNMIGYTTSNAGADLAPWQAAAPALGNNPLAYAIPAGRHPTIVLDMACSVVAKGKIRVARLHGERIPRGWVLGDTDDPNEAMNSPLAPFGTYKGSGLAFVNEVLSTILPAAKLSIEIGRSAPIGGEIRDPRGVGHTFIAIDVDAFQPVDEFLARVDELIEIIKSTPPADGYTEVLVPGEPEHRAHQTALHNGIPFHPGFIAPLRDLGAEVGVPFD